MIKWIANARNGMVLKTSTFLTFLTLGPYLYCAPPETAFLGLTPTRLSDEGYTINFNNISILEFIRFVGKITNNNFLYNEADLQFSVTVMSEEPTKSADIMAALVQVLRVHGLSILEIDNNLLIHKSPDVNQLATIVTPEGKAAPHAVIVTRLFRLKNANPTKIASLLRPMVSKGALIESDDISRYLIITDISVNVDRIAELLTSLDTPQTFLEIDAYSVKNALPNTLISLATQIIMPLTEGNPFILVPQADTMTIFIISTPFLIDKALTILHDLDIPPATKTRQKISEQNIEPSTQFYVYHAKNLSIDGLNEIVQETLDELKESRLADPAFLRTLASCQPIPLTNSLLFTGDAASIAKVEALLTSLDIPETGEIARAEKPQFFLYKLQHVAGDMIEKELKNLARNLQSSDLASDALIKAINNIKWVKETNSLLITGTPDAIAELKIIIAEYDVSRTTSDQPSQFLLYKPKTVSAKELQDVIKELARDLKASGLSDPELIHAISTMQYVEATNSLLFTAPPSALEKLNALLASLDNPDTLRSKIGAFSFFIYKVQNTSGQQLMLALQKVADELKKSGSPDKELIESIDSMRYLADNNSILFTGNSAALEKVQGLAEKLDVATDHQKATQFLIYKPHYLTTVQLEEGLREMIDNLEKAGLADTALIQAIHSMRYVANTDSLAFTASPDTLEKVKALISTIDIPLKEEGKIQRVGETTFLIYKIKGSGAPQLIAHLKSVTAELSKQNFPDKRLIQTINNLRYIPETNSILFIGDDATLQKAQQLAEKFDTPGAAPPPASPSETFAIYKPRFQTGPELLNILCNFKENLILSGVNDPGLFTAIDHLKWLEQTSSILIAGSPESITKVEDLLKQFDLPGGMAGSQELQPTINNTSFLVYKLQYHQGNEILTALKQVALELKDLSSVNQDFLTAVNSLQWIIATNSLIGSGTQDTLARLKELIGNLDIPLRQVFIEVLMIETTISDALTYGLEWAAGAKYRKKFGAGASNSPEPPLVPTPGPDTFITNFQSINAANTPTGPNQFPLGVNGFDLGVIGDIIFHKGQSFVSLGALVNALQTEQDGTIVLNQKIITQDNRNSTIFVGQNLPYTGSIITTVGAAQQTSANVEYRDIGVSLSITPTLGDEDIITLDIDVEDTEAPNFPQGNTSSSTVQGIATSKTSMTTRVHVPDQHFLVLSGMMRNTTTHAKQGLPCLGGLPVIGAAFSVTQDQKTLSNVIIFVRPHIINTTEEYKQVTQGQEELYRSQANEEEFDAGIDLVKKPEDE